MKLLAFPIDDSGADQVDLEEAYDDDWTVAWLELQVTGLTRSKPLAAFLLERTLLPSEMCVEVKGEIYDL